MNVNWSNITSYDKKCKEQLYRRYSRLCMFNKSYGIRRVLYGDVENICKRLILDHIAILV